MKCRLYCNSGTIWFVALLTRESRDQQRVHSLATRCGADQGGVYHTEDSALWNKVEGHPQTVKTASIVESLITSGEPKVAAISYAQTLVLGRYLIPLSDMTVDVARTGADLSAYKRVRSVPADGLRLMLGPTGSTCAIWGVKDWFGCDPSGQYARAICTDIKVRVDPALMRWK